MPCTLLKNGKPVAGSTWNIFEPMPVGAPVEFDVIVGYNAAIDHDTVSCTVFVTAITTTV